MALEVVRERVGGIWRTVVRQEAGGGGSQPFTPTDLDGLALWLDASTLALADDDPVATWPDASDSGFDAAQADPDFQPVCKTAALNGLRVVRFASSPDVQNLALSGGGLGLFRNLDGCTIAAVVASPTSTGTFFPLCASAAGDNTLRRVGLNVDGDGVAGMNGCNDDSGSDAETTSLGFSKNTDLAPPVAAIGTIDFARGGTLVATSMPYLILTRGAFPDTPGPTPDTPSAAVLVGAFPDASSGSDCDFGEILVYQRALNATERREVLEYLSSKWATL